MGLSCFKSWKHQSGGKKGNRDVLASPGSYFFLSNSAGQGDEWLQSLNKGVWIPFTGVFGQRLEETVLYERRYGVHLVPLVVEQCVTFIRDHGLHEAGLFRLPGRASLVRELQEAFDCGERPSFGGSTDVHTVASLLKLYLRRLPEPLVPFGRYQDFLLCARRLASQRAQALGELRNLLGQLPFSNFNLLSFICRFLNEVQSCSSSNRTSVQNLAAVFGPDVLRAKADEPQSIMGGASLVRVLMLELIREHESLFGQAAAPGSAHTPLACSRHLSLPLISESSGSPAASPLDSSRCFSSSAAASEQKRLRGHRHTSSHPENCLYPRPSASGELLGRASGSGQAEEAPQERCWEQAWTGLGGGFSGFWSSAAAEGAVGGGGSGSPEGSTLSSYDNLSVCLRAGQEVEGELLGSSEEEEEEEEEGEERASSPWSSCEILPLDGSDDAADVPAPETSPKEEEPDEHQDSEEEEGEEEACCPASPASCSLPSDVSLSTGSSDVFLPAEPEAPCLLSRLQQEMARQRAEHRDRILRLERCNDILKHQIMVLRISLEQQKRSRSVAEGKIRNMERERADADLRNAALQREMEHFFQNYGQIKKGGAGGARGGASL